MEFRDLKTQYKHMKKEIDSAVESVFSQTNFISGIQVKELEEELAAYVGTRHCIACANGTDALHLALMTWDIKEGDAVFVPDFTFFSTAEVVSLVGATPVFVDVDSNTFNMSPKSLQDAIDRIIAGGKLVPRVIIPVDLFGLPADYPAISKVARKYNMYILEDGAQGFGGSIGDRKACSFGNISTTSFFPAKPLGCYGDGGAIFTDDDKWAELLCSYRVHGKGEDKYNNVRIGLNSRLDTLQAAILQIKLRHFKEHELKMVNRAAEWYGYYLKDYVQKPVIDDSYKSSWAQYTILVKDELQRECISSKLKAAGIPSMIYYPRGLHDQKAFHKFKYQNQEKYLMNTIDICKRCLSLPMHPYLTEEKVKSVAQCMNEFYE